VNKRLLDDVVADMDKDRADSEYIRDRFVDVGREYIDEADDPTTEQVEDLVEHFEDRDPDDIAEETLAVLWTVCGIFRWMLDGLPIQDQTTTLDDLVVVMPSDQETQNESDESNE
jgi:hypothetical protein